MIGDDMSAGRQAQALFVIGLLLAGVAIYVWFSATGPTYRYNAIEVDFEEENGFTFTSVVTGERYPATLDISGVICESSYSRTCSFEHALADGQVGDTDESYTWHGEADYVQIRETGYNYTVYRHTVYRRTEGERSGNETATLTPVPDDAVLESIATGDVSSDPVRRAIRSGTVQTRSPIEIAERYEDAGELRRHNGEYYVLVPSGSARGLTDCSPGSIRFCEVLRVRRLAEMLLAGALAFGSVWSVRKSGALAERA